MRRILFLAGVVYFLFFININLLAENKPVNAGIYKAGQKDSLTSFLVKSRSELESNTDRALYFAQKAEHLARSLDEEDKLATALFYAGVANTFLENYTNAKDQLLNSLVLFEELKDTSYFYTCHYYLGNAFSNLSDYHAALESYFKALDYYSSTDSLKNLADVYQNIGIVYSELEDQDKAKRFYEKAITINQELKDFGAVAALYHNIGTVESKKGNDSMALVYYNNSLKTFEDINDIQGIGSTFSNIGELELRKGRVDDAKLYFDSAYVCFNEIDLKVGKVWTLFNLGVCAFYKESFKEAERLYTDCLNLSSEIQNSEGKLSSYEALYNLFEKQQDYAKALNYYKEFIALGDSIHFGETQERIAKLETKISLDSSKKEIIRINNELKRKKTQNKAFLGIFAIVLLTSVIVFYAYRQKHQAEKKLAEHKADLEKIIELRTKELEEEITGRRIAEESDKLKSAFLANMSHELRTPMNAIIAFSNFLRSPDLTSDHKQEYIDHISSAGGSLLCLIDDIIDIAKIESGQLNIFVKATDITRLHDDLFKVFSELKKKKNKDQIELKLNIDKEFHYIINTDENRLKQILSNLLDNALKYSCKGTVEFGFLPFDNEIEFYVEDTGTGIPKSRTNQIFKRFYQLNDNNNDPNTGTGLGLAICKNLVELLGGNIHVDSIYGEGSRFYFTIPVDSIKKQYIPKLKNKKELEPIDTENVSFENKTILVAEDEELNYKVLDNFLKRINANVLRAKDGAAAIEIIQKEKIDLVLMDIQMPVLDGYDATKEIKRFNNRIPVIAQTSFAMDGEKEKCIEAGCDDFITKPLDLNLLVNKIRNYIS